MKRILVLGANGYLGKNLVDQLLINNYSVVAYDKSPFPNSLKHKNLKMIVGNLENEYDWDEIIKDIDVIFHLISIMIPSSPSEEIPDSIRKILLPTLRLLEAMRDKNKKMIFLSSGGTVYGNSVHFPSKVTDVLNPICAYGAEKVVEETYILLYNRIYNNHHICVRAANPYGKGQNSSKVQGIIPILMQKMMSGECIEIYGDGSTKRDFIYIDDLISALLSMISYSGKKSIFNVGSGISYSINTIVETLMNVCQKPNHKLHYSNQRDFDVKIVDLDISDTIKELNWHPIINLEEGISLVFQEQYHCP